MDNYVTAFINDNLDILDESILKFIELAYDAHLTNNQMIQLIETLKQVDGLEDEVIYAQSKVFLKYFEPIASAAKSGDILSSVLYQMNNLVGYTYRDTNAWVADTLTDWDFDNYGDLVKI